MILACSSTPIEPTATLTTVTTVTTEVTDKQCKLLFPEVKYKPITTKYLNKIANQRESTIDQFVERYHVPPPLVHSADLPGKPVLPRTENLRYGTNGFINAI